MEVLGLADAVLDIGAVVGDRAVDVGAAAHEVAELAAEAVADRANLAVALRQPLQEMPGVLHVAHGEVVVEVVVEIERLLDVFGIVIGELDARLLPPEQIRHQAHEPRLREFMRVPAHGVVDAPDFHDGDDGARRRAVRDRDIGSHLAVAQLDLDGLRFHADRLHADAWAAVRAGSLSSARALPANIFSRSAEEMGSASIASMVLAIRPRPCSASNGASVANRQDAVPKNACPQRVGAIAPLSAVSA